MIIYISGSVTDGGTLPPEEIESRIRGFDSAETVLLGQGFEVLNPARHGADPDKTWLDYMRLALIDISKADAIATLPGWEKSKGAVVEVTLARGLGLPVGDFMDWVTLLSTPVIGAEADEVGAGEPASPPEGESAP